MINEAAGKYKERVNFVWVYSVEAHPSQSFPEGDNVTDLGWEHPTAEEPQARVERAAWLKAEQCDGGCNNLNFVVDNDASTVKREFYGSGFYSGYVIGCNKQILADEPWAWVGPDFQWYSLPLAPILKLYDFLDDYLDAPADCNKLDADKDSDSTDDTKNSDSPGTINGESRQIDSSGCTVLPAASQREPFFLFKLLEILF